MVRPIAVTLFIFMAVIRKSAVRLSDAGSKYSPPALTTPSTLTCLTDLAHLGCVRNTILFKFFDNNEQQSYLDVSVHCFALILMQTVLALTDVTTRS